MGACLGVYILTLVSRAVSASYWPCPELLSSTTPSAIILCLPLYPEQRSQPKRIASRSSLHDCVFSVRLLAFNKTHKALAFRETMFPCEMDDNSVNKQDILSESTGDFESSRIGAL